MHPFTPPFLIPTIFHTSSSQQAIPLPPSPPSLFITSKAASIRSNNINTVSSDNAGCCATIAVSNGRLKSVHSHVWGPLLLVLAVLSPPPSPLLLFLLVLSPVLRPTPSSSSSSSPPPPPYHEADPAQPSQEFLQLPPPSPLPPFIPPSPSPSSSSQGPLFDQPRDGLTLHRPQTIHRLTKQGEQDVVQEEEGAGGGQFGKGGHKGPRGCSLSKKRGGREGGREGGRRELKSEMKEEQRTGIFETEFVKPLLSPCTEFSCARSLPPSLPPLP